MSEIDSHNQKDIIELDKYLICMIRINYNRKITLNYKFIDFPNILY